MKKAVNYIAISISSPRVDTKFFWVILLTFLTSVSAQIQIPTQPVPVTFQTFTVLLGAAFLGRYKASASQIIYLLLGCAGVPVFAGFSFGIARILGPTGGYLSGYVLASYLIGYMVEKNKTYIWIFFSMLCGSLVIFTLGVIQLNAVYFLDWGKAIKIGFIDFAVWDLLKILAASFIYYTFIKNKSSD